MKLLHRTTRRIVVTEAGQRYLEYARQARDALGDGDRAVSAVRTEVEGLIRLTAPTSLGDAFLIDLLADIRERHPLVRFDIDLSIETRDIILDGIDFAFRMSRTIDPNLVARPLGLVKEVIVASPTLLSNHFPQGVQSPSQLTQLETLRHANFRDEGRWMLTRDTEQVEAPVVGALAINHYIGVRRAALRSQGIARLPRYLVNDEIREGRLIEVLPNWQLPSTPIFLVYPERKSIPRRSAAFRDFAIEWMKNRNPLGF